MSANRAICALALAFAAGLSGCSTHPAGMVSFHEIRLARSFRPITIYWVGRSFQGVSLSSLDDGYDYEAAVGMRVYYGDCEHRSSLLDTGCTLPLQITSVIYEPHSNRGLGASRAITVRGVPALVFAGGRQIELYTGYEAVDITADTPRRAIAAAEALAPLNEPPPLTGGLPAPDFHPGQAIDPQAKALANALRALPSTDTDLTQPQPTR